MMSIEKNVQEIGSTDLAITHAHHQNLQLRSERGHNEKYLTKSGSRTGSILINAIIIPATYSHDIPTKEIHSESIFED